MFLSQLLHLKTKNSLVVKNGALLFAVLILASSTAIHSQKPVLYPGAHLQSPGSKYFLTSDSYEKVRAFYIGIYGEPDYEKEKIATFFYEETIFEPAGIHVNGVSANGKSAARVFAELQRLKKRGEAGGKEILSEQRYGEIFRNYEYLNDNFYMYAKDERGNFVSEDEIIFRKYNKKLDIGAIEDMNAEEITQKAHQLFMQGQIQEGRELLERLQGSMTEHLEFSGSAEVVDEWIECLKEIDACKYPVMIRIDGSWSDSN